MADEVKPGVEKEAAGLAGKVFKGILGATPLGTLILGANEVSKRTGNGDQLGKLETAVTDGAGKLAAGAAAPAASAASGAGVKIGITAEDAQKAMVAEGQARMADLNQATGAVKNTAVGFWDRFRGKDAPESMKDTRRHDPNLDAKVAAGAYLGYVDQQPPAPVETRILTPVSGAGPATNVGSVEPPPVGPNNHTDAHDRHWAAAKVEATVAVATAQASAKTADPPVVAPVAAPAPAAATQGPKLPPKQVLTVPKGAKATDITKMLNENGLDRTQKGQNGPAIVNRKYYDTSKDQKPLELADAMQAEFRVARDAPRDPDPTVAKAKTYDPVKPSAFEMDYT